MSENQLNRMSTAEIRSYQQMCDDNGNILVIAIDQRNGMRELVRQNDNETRDITAADLGEIKADLVRYLANHAPAVLLDPNCALPAVVDKQILARDVALVIGLDDSGYDIDPNSLRQTRLVSGISPQRVRQLGSTIAKLLVHMRPDQDGSNGFSAELIQKTAQEYTDEDLLLVVEYLVYQLPQETEDEYNATKAELIIDSAKIAVDQGAKVLKLQFPGSAEACAEVTRVSRGVPWAMLSAGVDHTTFLEQLQIARENGASGAIAGRSLWKDCVSLDPEKRKVNLTNRALPRLREIQDLLLATS